MKVLLLVMIGISMVFGHGEHNAHLPPEQRPTSFNDPKITQDEAHLKEHLKDEINVKQNMSPEEMEFHYFRLHDTNNDTHLDGIEIWQAMAHMLPVPELQLHEKLGKSKEQIELMMEERTLGMQKYYEDMIDNVMKEDDLNKDGYLTYSEFVRARRREEFHARRMHEEQMRQQQLQFQQFQQFQAMQQNQMNNNNFQPTVPPPNQGKQVEQMNQQQQQQQFNQQQQQFNQQQQQQHQPR
ncbi:hypothetical protein ACF0H5_003096 [Mactra antiquata]